MSLSAPPPQSTLDDLPPDGGRINRFINRLLEKLRVEEVPHIKRIIVTVVGGTILILGVVMVVTPGPAVIVVPAGLAILGTEYAWARRWLRKAKQMPDMALSRTQRFKRAIRVLWGRWRHHKNVDRQTDLAASERDLVPVPGSVYEGNGSEDKQG